MYNIWELKCAGKRYSPVNKSRNLEEIAINSKHVFLCLTSSVRCGEKILKTPVQWNSVFPCLLFYAMDTPKSANIHYQKMMICKLLCCTRFQICSERCLFIEFAFIDRQHSCSERLGWVGEIVYDINVRKHMARNVLNAHMKNR